MANDDRVALLGALLVAGAVGALVIKAQQRSRPKESAETPLLESWSLGVIGADEGARSHSDGPDRVESRAVPRRRPVRAAALFPSTAPGIAALAILITLLLLGQAAVVVARSSASEPEARGPASEQARGIAPAPAEDAASLLLNSAPGGFQSVSSGIITLDALAAQSPNPDAAKGSLTTLGFHGGYQHVWMNRDIHESIVVADGEYGSPTAAAIHKIAVEHSWSSQNRPRFPVPDVAGAVGAQDVVQSPGKYPESEYSVIFRIERWEFVVTVGNAVGPSGAVPATPALARQVTDQELAAVRPVLRRWIAAEPVDGSRVLRDDTCRCSIALPATWDVLPYQPDLLTPGVQQFLNALPSGSDALFPSAKDISREVGKALIFSGRDTSSESGVVFARFPTRTARANQMEQLANLFGALGANGSAFPEATRVDLPLGKVTQVTLNPFVTGPLAGATETISAFEYRGWTYVVGFFTLDPAANHATSDRILRSIRVRGL